MESSHILDIGGTPVISSNSVRVVNRRNDIPAYDSGFAGYLPPPALYSPKALSRTIFCLSQAYRWPKVF